jgi:hypothetical protein
MSDPESLASSSDYLARNKSSNEPKNDPANYRHRRNPDVLRCDQAAATPRRLKISEWPSFSCHSRPNRLRGAVCPNRSLNPYRRQLDYSRRLTFTQARQEDDLAIWQFQRVVMHRSAPNVHLAESGHSCAELFRR